MTDTQAAQAFNVNSVRESFADLVHLKTAHTERLERVEEELHKLHQYKSDYVHLNKRLCTLPDRITHQVMVPLGSLAFMPGQLIHTNEVLVLLGDNWFAERSTSQAVKIVKRRIQDCDEKIKRAESTRFIHQGWLREAEELLTGESGERVDILERVSEEEYQRDQELHRINVSKHHKQEREKKKQERERSEEEERFSERLEERDRKSYEDIMKRLDALEMEEEEEEEKEEEEEEEEGIGEEEEEIEHEEEREREKGRREGEKRGREWGEEEVKVVVSSAATVDVTAASNTTAIMEDLSTKAKETTAVDTATTELPAARTSDAVATTTTASGPVAATSGDLATAAATSHRHLKQKPKLKRRVSWADDARPLYTIIPDDTSEQIYRIKYCTGPLSLSLDLDTQDTTDSQNPEVETQSTAGIRSPSDLYRVFAGEGVAVGGGGGGMGEGGVEIQQRPRGILKKATSLPCQDDSGDSWCLPPAPLDLEDEDSPPPSTPPPPPSPPPHRSTLTSSLPAFTYQVQEHKPKTPSTLPKNEPRSTSVSASSTSVSTSNPQPKRVSKFKAARMKK